MFSFELMQIQKGRRYKSSRELPEDFLECSVVGRVLEFAQTGLAGLVVNVETNSSSRFGWSIPDMELIRLN